MKLPASIGAFEVLDRLGRGGMGTVYKVRGKDDQIVALKQLSDQSADVSHRFKREFRAAARLQHKNIVSVYELHEDPCLCFTMEYVDGTDLLRFVQGSNEVEPLRDPDQFRRVFFTLGQILKALDYIHAQGIVHRDLKPDNVLVTPSGAVKVTDFGLAKLDEDASSFVTTVGTVMGTVGFLAPEQIVGQPVDARTDLYALGVLLYQLLTGQLPFPQRDPIAVMHSKVKGERPVPPTELNDSLDAGWERVTLKLLQREPGRRYQEIGELFGELKALWADSGMRGEDQAFDQRKLLTRSRSVLNSASLIGRKAELDKLDAALETLVAGRGGVVFVDGEAGIGKSRLLADLRGLGRSRRVKVFQALAPVTRLPYGHFHPTLGRIADWLASWDRKELRRIVTAEWAALKLLAPRFNKIAAVRNLDLPTPLPPRQARDRDLRVLRLLFEELVAAGPTMLIVEDLHACDDASLALLEHLTSQLASAGAPLLIVASFRTDELSDPARRYVARLPEALRLTLGRLGEVEIAQLISEMTGGNAASSAIVQSLVKRSGGNPLLVEQTVRGLVENGHLKHQSGRWEVVPDADDDGEDDDGGDITTDLSDQTEIAGPMVAESIEQALEERLTRLDERTRRVLEFGAVAAESFRSEVVAAAAELDEGAVLDALNEALRAGLVTEPERAYEGYTFSHQRVRDVLMKNIAAERRRAIHGVVGGALERLERPPIEELALHFHEAGMFEKAAEYLPRAARAYADRFDNPGALEAYRRALGTLDAFADAERPAELAVTLRCEAAEVAELAGQLADALAWSREGSRLARAAGLEEAAAIATIAEARILCTRNQLGKARELAEAALKSARAMDARSVEARAHDDLGRIARRSERFEEAEGHFRAALALHHELGDKIAAAETMVHLATVARKRGGATEAAELLDKARDLCRQTTNQRGMAMALAQLGSLRLAQCDFAEARVRLQDALAIDRDIGNLRGVGLDLSGLGLLSVTVGAHADATAQFDEALAIFRDLEDRANEARTLVNLGHVRFRSGEPAAAIELYRAADTLFVELGHKGGSAEALSAMSAAETKLGRLAKARELAQRGIALAREVGLREKEAWALLTLARAATDLVAAERAVDLAGRVGDRNLLFQALHCQAQVLRRQRDEEAGRAALDRAVAIIEELARSMGPGGQEFLRKPAVREVYTALGVDPPRDVG